METAETMTIVLGRRSKKIVLRALRNHLVALQEAFSLVEYASDDVLHAITDTQNLIEVFETCPKVEP